MTMLIRIAMLTAIISFLGAAPAWPASVEDALKEALSLHEAGKPEEAIRQYDRAIQMNPRMARAYLERGNAYADLGDDQRALKDYSEAIRLDAKSAEAHYNRANTYRRLGQRELALKDYGLAIKHAPENEDKYLSHIHKTEPTRRVVNA
jgi:tetratricopeptide (TPR) repeat protein